MSKKIIIADDHPIVIQGIQGILAAYEEYEVIGIFNNGQSLLESNVLLTADLLLLDLNMPDTDGFTVIENLKSKNHPLKIIVITSYHSPQLIERCLAAGVSGYLIKSEELHALAESIRKVFNGESVYPTAIPSAEQDNEFSFMDTFMQKYRLTKREVEIITLLCHSYSSQEIADKLYLSTFTIQTHRKNILRKLNIDNSKISLYKFAIENKLIPG